MKKLPQILALAFLVLLALYAGFGYLGVPRILAAEVPAAIEEQFGRKTSIGEVSFDPFLFQLEVQELRVLDQRGGDLAGFSLLSVDFDPLTSLFDLELHFKEFVIVEPLIDVEMLAGGELDVSDILGGDSESEPAAPEPAPAEKDVAEGAAAEEDSSLPAVRFEMLAIRGGVFHYADTSRTPAFERTMGPIEIEITDFGTQPGEESPYAFRATTARGAEISWAGRFGLDPLTSAGELTISQIPIPWFWEFVEDRARFAVADGKLEVAASYDVTTADGVTDYGIRDGSIAISSLSITPRDDEAPFISLPDLVVSGIEVDLDAQSVEIEKLSSTGARLAAGLDPDGAFTWLAWLALDPVDGEADAAETQEGAEEPAAEEAPPWTLELAALELSDWSFAFWDETTSPAAAIALEPISLAVRDISLDLGKPLPVRLETGVGEAGRILVEGDVTPDPLLLDLDLEIDEVDLTPFAPYLADVGRFTLRRAKAGAAGHLRLEPAEGAPVVRYAGSVRLSELAAADRTKRRDFVRLDALSVEGIDVVSDPLEVTIAEVRLEKPFVRVLLDSEGQVNLAQVFAGEASTEAAEDAAAEEQEAAAEGSPIRVDRVSLDGAVFEFIDQSLEPSYETSLELSGAIGGLSSDPRARAKVDLEGKLDSYAPMLIKGEINPLAAEGYTDLVISLRNLELSSFTPYSGKFAGYELAKGKFTMDLSYQVASRDVKGENKIFLDQLELGDRVESEHATQLPVPLALAILKDQRGEINIDLPVHGNLDDPKFSYGATLRRTLLNLVTKAATSPFSMLGKLAGLNADALEFVAFEPGTAVLGAEEIKKLAAIAGVLAERPALRLEIHGTAAPEDIPGLKVAALEHALKQRRWDDMSERARSALAGPDDVVLSPDEREDELESLYQDQFDESFRGLRGSIRDEREERGEPDPEDEDGVVYAAMAERLREAQRVGDGELRALAQARATAVKSDLVDANAVANERVFLVEVEVAEPGDGASVHCPLKLAGS